VLSFLSELGPLIRVGSARARIEPGRVGLGPGPNSGLSCRTRGPRAYWPSIAMGIDGRLALTRWVSTGTTRKSTAQARLGPASIVPVPGTTRL
jgi:hypothetical protein